METTAGGPEAKESLSSLEDLFKSSWEFFKKVFSKLILIGLVGLLAMGVVWLISISLGWFAAKLLPGFKAITAPVFVGLVVAVSLILFLWVNLGWLFGIVKVDIGVRESLRLSREKFPSYLWVAILTILIVSLGSLIFIIPGVLFAVWFIFAPFILVEEDLRGWKALQKSRELVRGRWWPVFGRLLIMWLITVAVSMLPGVGQILSIIILPFSFVYSFVLYKNLKAR